MDWENNHDGGYMTGTTLTLLGLCLLGIATMSCLSLAMPRHGRQVSSAINRSFPIPLMRWVGWSLLAILLVTAIGLEGWSLGLVSALGALSLSSLVVILLLTYRPKWLFHTTVAGALAGFLTIVVQAILN